MDRDGEAQWKLEHLWIDPVEISKGLGRNALEFLIGEAKTKNVKSILILPDPPAEGFYKKLGVEYTGKSVRSRVP